MNIIEIAEKTVDDVYDNGNIIDISVSTHVGQQYTGVAHLHYIDTNNIEKTVRIERDKDNGVILSLKIDKEEFKEEIQEIDIENFNKYQDIMSIFGKIMYFNLYYTNPLMRTS